MLLLVAAVFDAPVAENARRRNISVGALRFLARRDPRLSQKILPDSQNLVIPGLTRFPGIESVEIRIFHVSLLENGNVRVRIFPQRKKVVIGG